MQTFEAIINRKGVRSFTDQQITDEQLKKLIHAANAAPISGGKPHIKSGFQRRK